MSQEPRSKRVIGIVGAESRHERRNVFRRVLAVRVERQDVAGALRKRESDACLQSGALAEIRGMCEQPRSARQHPFTGTIVRPVVYHNDMADITEQLVQHWPDPPGFIQGRDDDPEVRRKRGERAARACAGSDVLGHATLLRKEIVSSKNGAQLAVARTSDTNRGGPISQPAMQLLSWS